MAINTKGKPVTYGTKTGGGIISLVATRLDANGTEGKAFEGSMYASEIRVSYDSDQNTAVNGEGETISYCVYNKRRTLSLTGIMVNTANGVPDGSTDNIANADATFAKPLLPGDNLYVGMGSSAEWEEVQADDTQYFGPTASGNQHGSGKGNYVITSIEKTRSNGAFAEWSITAIEHITAVVTSSDTGTD
jgi:hypothetical protein